jgi:hypothetical protein
VILRRAALVAAGLLWLGMLGALGVMEHRKRAQSLGAAGYIDSIFGPQAPALVHRSLRLQEFAGAEQDVGSIEVQTQLSGENEALVKTLLEIQSRKIPPLVTEALTQFLGPPADLSGELSVYVGRFKGITRIEGKGSYGEQSLDFSATRFRDKQLKIITRHGKERNTSYVPYDRELPFTGDLSPIKGGRDLKLGDSWTVAHFNPMTRTSVETLIKVEEEAVLKYQREAVRCWVLRAHPVASGPGGSGGFGISSSTAWVARKPGDKLDGQVLREEVQLLFFKLALVLEDIRSHEELRKDRMEASAAAEPPGAARRKPGERAAPAPAPTPAPAPVQR